MIYNKIIDEKYLNDAIKIFLDGFDSKYSSVIKNKLSRVLIYQTMLRNTPIIFQVENDKLVSIMIYATPTNKNKINFKSYNKDVKFKDRFKAHIINSIIIHEASENESYVQFVAVDKNSRGKGYGKSIFSYFEKFSSTSGFEQMCLDVIDTNPKAKKLYENLGFKSVKTISIKQVKNIFKWEFSSLDRMVKKLK